MFFSFCSVCKNIETFSSYYVFCKKLKSRLFTSSVNENLRLALKKSIFNFTFLKILILESNVPK